MKIKFSILAFILCANICLSQAQTNENIKCDSFYYTSLSDDQLLKYIEDPCPNDTTCKNEIIKAKTDIADGRLTFCMPEGLGIHELRQEQQLKELCSHKGLIFDYELTYCVVHRGQTHGCYGLYMDKIIALNFGKDFKENLLKEADSLYVQSDPIVYFTNCDSFPKLYGKDLSESREMNVPISNKLLNQLKRSKYGFYPQVEVGFYIDTLGNASNYFLNRFIIYDDLLGNNKYKDQLLDLAFKFIKQFKTWKPGIALNKKVKTEYSVLLSFVGENSGSNSKM